MQIIENASAGMHLDMAGGDRGDWSNVVPRGIAHGEECHSVKAWV